MQREHYACPIVKPRSGQPCGRTSVYADRCGRCSSAARQQVRRNDGRPAPALCACGCGLACRTSTGFRGDCRPLENARARSARYRDKRLRLVDDVDDAAPALVPGDGDDAAPALEAPDEEVPDAVLIYAMA
jgi:hypothetical protein